MNKISSYYFDTSALLPYYRQEALSEKVEKLLQTMQGKVMISWLTEVEIFSAIARWERLGEINRSEMNVIQETFNQHLNQSMYYSLPLSKAIFQQAKAWLATGYTALRTLDALHLACAYHAQVKIISADYKLIQAAQFFELDCLYLTTA
jgi:predicted nucleic acid-binding protein